jgi:hypothetical protein
MHTGRETMNVWAAVVAQFSTHRAFQPPHFRHDAVAIERWSQDAKVLKVCSMAALHVVHIPCRDSGNKEFPSLYRRFSYADVSTRVNPCPPLVGM